MATDKVDIAETNAISASQMSEFFRLAGIPDSHINRKTFQAFLERRSLFAGSGMKEMLQLANLMDKVRYQIGVSEEQFRILWTPEGRPHLERMIAGLKNPAAEVVDTIIRVDRSIVPVYPDFTKTVMNLGLETTGPVKYSLSEVEFWLHEGQRHGQRIEGHELYGHLRDNGILEDCLSLRDGEEIQKKGPVTFRRFFGGKFIFLWKSVVQSRDGYPWVPYLSECAEQVFMDWRRLDAYWDGSLPVARLAGDRFLNNPA